MIDVTCTSCHRVLQAPDSAAGRRSKCPNCREPVQIPAAPESVPAPVSAAAPPLEGTTSQSVRSEAGESLASPTRVNENASRGKRVFRKTKEAKPSPQIKPDEKVVSSEKERSSKKNKTNKSIVFISGIVCASLVAGYFVYPPLLGENGVFADSANTQSISTGSINELIRA